MTALTLILTLASFSPTARAFACYRSADDANLSLLYPEDLEEVGTVRLGDFQSAVFCDETTPVLCQLEDDGGRFELDLSPGQARLRPRGPWGRRTTLRAEYPLRALTSDECARLFPRRGHIEF